MSFIYDYNNVCTRKVIPQYIDCVEELHGDLSWNTVLSKRNCQHGQWKRMVALRPQKKLSTSVIVCIVCYYKELRLTEKLYFAL